MDGAAVKLPLRLEFVAKNLARGDPVGAGVGLSWMLLGDAALAFNDAGVRGWASRAARGPEGLEIRGRLASVSVSGTAHGFGSRGIEFRGRLTGPPRVANLGSGLGS